MSMRHEGYLKQPEIARNEITGLSPSEQEYAMAAGNVLLFLLCPKLLGFFLEPGSAINTSQAIPRRYPKRGTKAVWSGRCLYSVVVATAFVHLPRYTDSIVLQTDQLRLIHPYMTSFSYELQPLYTQHHILNMLYVLHHFVIKVWNVIRNDIVAICLLKFLPNSMQIHYGNRKGW